ncbi:hypothetical protein JL722_7418 [Aureococcus anophagefferens]|nr:hypothetical protein JL722_7418 [Aureococcus anophagefferens]
MGAATPPLEISMDTGAQKHPHKIEALLCWAEALWQELKVPAKDQKLFLGSLGLPERSLTAIMAARRVEVHVDGAGRPASAGRRRQIARQNAALAGTTPTRRPKSAPARGRSPSPALGTPARRAPTLLDRARVGSPPPASGTKKKSSQKKKQKPSASRSRTPPPDATLGGHIWNHNDAERGPPDARCGPLAAHVQLLVRFRAATLRVLREVRRREEQVREIKACYRRLVTLGSAAPGRGGLSAPEDDDSLVDDPSSAAALVFEELRGALAAVNVSTARVVGAVAAWRCYQWRPGAFLWKGACYLTKCTTDLRFLEGATSGRGALRAALGTVMQPWKRGAETNLVWFGSPPPGSRDARARRKRDEAAGRDVLQRWIRATLDLGGDGGDRAAAGDAAASTVWSFFSQPKAFAAAVDATGDADFGEARRSLLEEPALQLVVSREQVRLGRGLVDLPMLRWLPRLADAPVVLAACGVYRRGPPQGARGARGRGADAPRDGVGHDGGPAPRRRAEPPPRGALEGPEPPPDAASPEKSPGSPAKRKKSALATAGAAVRAGITATHMAAKATQKIDDQSHAVAARRLQRSFRLKKQGPGDAAETGVLAGIRASHHRSKDRAAKQRARRRHGALTRNVTGLLAQELPDDAQLVSNVLASKTTRQHQPLVDLSHSFKLADVPCHYEATPHGLMLRDALPPVPSVDGDGIGPTAVRARAARARHWDGEKLSGVYAIKVAAPCAPVAEEAADGPVTPVPMSPPPRPEDEPRSAVAARTTLSTVRWNRADGYQIVDEASGKPTGEPPGAKLLWCLRVGQRLALMRGRMPHDVVWAMATVVSLDRITGYYHLYTDNGAGLKFDPSGQRRRRLGFALLDPSQVRRRQAFGGLPALPGSLTYDRHATGGSMRPIVLDEALADGDALVDFLGFAVDEENVVVRVDAGSRAEKLGVMHGWVVTRLGGSTAKGRANLGAAVKRLFYDDHVRHVDVDFEVLVHELCRPGVRYESGQRLSVLYRTRWHDAIVLRPQPQRTNDEAVLVSDATRTRLRVFLGDDNSAVETATMNLNKANHGYHFMDASDYVEQLKVWRAERNEWGDMFEAVRRRCAQRAHATLERSVSYHGLDNGAADIAQRCRAPDGSLWRDVHDLRVLTQALLYRCPDRARGAVRPARLLLVEGPKEDQRLLLMQRRESRRKLAEEQGRRRSLSEASQEAPAPPSRDATPAAEDRKSRVNALFEAIPIATFGEQSKKLATDAAVRAAASKIGNAWIRKSMAHYADVRTAKGQLRVLLLSLSATQQYGHETTHLVPYLIKASTLNRIAAHVAAGHHHPTDGPSVIEHYLEAAYGRNQQPRYRMLMQALYGGRLLLLIDASRGAAPPGQQKKLAERRGKDGAPRTEDLTKNVIEDYLLERVILEVPRIVVTGDFSPKEEARLRERFVTIQVRQGLKQDHDDGIDAWLQAQNDRFSIPPNDAKQ